jgi:DNA-binding winged helix-turn-helix (wHTH) protein
MTSRTVDRPIYEFGPFRLDPIERLLVRDDQPVSLTPKAFDVLVYLIEHHGRLVEKQALLSAVWPDTVVEEVNLAYNISALRKVLDEHVTGTSMIQTVPTRGYRFVAPVSSSRPLAGTASTMARSGARVAFRSASYQEDVYVASFDRRRGVMGAPRRLTLDDRDDVPLDWTPDSTTVLLVSTRNGAAHIFKQRLDSDIAEPFITTPGSQEVVRLTSDGRWVLYKDRTPQGMRIMRVPLAGGTPELVYRGGGDLMCAAHGRCVLPQVEGDAQIVRSLDPIRGLAVNLVASRPAARTRTHCPMERRSRTSCPRTRALLTSCG